MGSTLLTLIESVKLKYGWSDKTLAENLGVSSHSILSWKSGRRSPKRSLEMRLEELGQKEERKNMEQSSYIIELQKEKIERLENDLLKHKSTPIQETVWNQLDFDFETRVKLTFENFTMGRTMLSITNIEIQSKILGYSIYELENVYDINVYHEHSKKHPIDKILHSKTLKDIKQQVKSLPNLFESLKNMMGNHYIPQPLTYVHKDKSLISAIAYNKVNWKEKTVNSKIKFLLNT